MSKRKAADQATSDSELDGAEAQPIAAAAPPSTELEQGKESESTDSSEQPTAAEDAGQAEVHPAIEPMQVRVGGRPDRSVRFDGPTVTKQVKASKDDPLPGTE